MKKIAVFASGNGSNFEALVQKAKDYKVAFLFCDRKDAYVLERAKKLNIPIRYASVVKEQENFEDVILSYLKEFEVDLIVLAGYMKLIGPKILDVWEGKIINIHPSLLPSYAGSDAIARAYEAGEKQIGISIHMVDRGMDTGKIIFRSAINVDPLWDLEETTKQVHAMEHLYYPKIVSRVLKGKK